MCGIAGYSGRFNHGFLAAANAKMAHRGPDNAGTWHDDSLEIGLAHRRLSIIDLSASANQPMHSADATSSIVYNGEIYNYRQLTLQLEQKGSVFQSRSDTEVLLHLYREMGHDMLARLNGIFAFALFDHASQELFLARDHLGVKPLYYTVTERGLLFASEIKALLCEPTVKRELNPHAIYNHLSFLWSPAPHTMLKNVYKLEPGHALLVKGGRIARKWQFYDLPYDQPVREQSKANASDGFVHHLRTAVQRQMVSDVPVGAFLSGGLDSSAVVTFARECVKKHKLQCFTIGFSDDSAHREGMTEDLPYARRVAAHLDVDLHVIQVGPEMALQLPAMVYHLDEPQADPAAINALFISRLAQQHGIKVLLSGLGGDDILTGYRRHFALTHEKYWSWMPSPARSLLARLAAGTPAHTPLLRRVAKALQYADIDEDERITSYFRWTRPGIAFSLCSPEIRSALQNDGAGNPLLDSLRRLPDNVPALNRMLYLEARHFLADHNLNYTDKMCMAESVEARVPFLDPDLVSFAATLPLSFKQHGCQSKHIIRKAMARFLPPYVIHRPKTGFGAPIRKWLRDDLESMVDALLSRDSINSRGLFDYDSVELLRRLDGTGRADNIYAILSLVCIELWCRLFIDNKSPDTIMSAHITAMRG